MFQPAELSERPKASEAWTEIDFLERHGAAKHLEYATYRRRGLPLGSGAVESAIRRVINLRMKGNSIFWKGDNAEGMLVLRGLVLSGRWKGTLAQITTSMSCDRRLDWQWRSPDMPEQLKTPDTVKPPTPQQESDQTTCAAAA